VEAVGSHFATQMDASMLRRAFAVLMVVMAVKNVGG
jgi:uncharacterized membrane protein YfcA